MIPDQPKIDEIIDVIHLLDEVKMDVEMAELIQAVKNQISNCWPTPDLPDDQPMPQYLQYFMDNY